MSVSPYIFKQQSHVDGTERNERNNVGKQLSRIRMFLLQSDHGIRLALATEISMESEDSDHTSLMINCQVISGYDMFCFLPLCRMMISISMASASTK